MLDWLTRAGASRDVIDGVRPIATSWEELYRECKRGDWLLGIAARAGVPLPLLVRAAVGSAKTAMTYVQAPEAERVLAAAAAFADGGPVEAVHDATADLDDKLAGARDPAEDAALRAVMAVGLGVDDPGTLASAPAAAAEATIVAVMDCAWSTAQRYAHATTANAVREAIPWADVAPLFAALR